MAALAAVSFRTVAGRLVITTFALCVWLTAFTAFQSRSRGLVGWGVLATLLVPAFVVLGARRINGLLPQASVRATLADFTIYCAFITKVSVDCAKAGDLHPDWYWYSIPASVTLGVVPQIESRTNRLVATALSATIFFMVLYRRGDQGVFVDHGVVWGYAMVLITAFSRDAADVCLNLVTWLGSKLRNGITNFLENLPEIRDDDHK